MTSAKRKKPKTPRRRWPRNPVQKPHSTPKGEKGYDRARDKDRVRDELDEDDQPVSNPE